MEKNLLSLWTIVPGYKKKEEEKRGVIFFNKYFQKVILFRNDECDVNKFNPEKKSKDVTTTKWCLGTKKKIIQERGLT